MSRLPYPDLETLSPAKRALVDTLGPKLLNVSRMAMHAPDPHWAAQRALGQAQVRESSFDKMLREIVILRVAHLSRSAYELYHHESMARDAGFTDAMLAAVRAGDPSPFTPPQRAAMRFTDEVVLDVSPSDATLAALRKHLSDSNVIELVILIGSYMLTARVAAVSGAEMDGEAVSDWANVPSDESVRQR